MPSSKVLVKSQSVPALAGTSGTGPRAMRVDSTDDAPVGVRQVSLATFQGLALLLSVVLYLTPLFRPFPLLDPDEGLHASIAQEMLEQGDWITPKFRGKPFFDKPIVFFWCQALSLKCLGMGDWGVRFPGLLFGWLGAVTTGLLAGRLFGRPVGWTAALMFMTLLLPLALAQAAVHDVALVPFTNLALLSLWESQRTAGRASWYWTLAAGTLLGLACLTKGLLGWPLIGVGYVLTLVVMRRLTIRTLLHGAIALCIGAVVASPWYFAMELRNPGFAWYYFIERHLLGYATATQQHGDRSWYYYLPILLGGAIPWGLLLPMAARDLWNQSRARVNSAIRDSATGESPTGVSGELVLMWLWLVGGLLFLTVAKSKLFTYLSPLLPAIAVIGAVFLERTWNARLAPALQKSYSRMTTLSWGLVLIGLPVALFILNHKLPQLIGPQALLVGCGLTALLTVPCVLWLRGRPVDSFCSLLGVIGVSFMLTTRLIVPGVTASTSQHQLAMHLNGLDQIPPQVLLVEERLGSVYFYLRQDHRASLSQHQIAFAEFDAPPVWNDIVTGAEIAVPHRVQTRFEKQIDLALFDRSNVGHYAIYRRKA